MMLALPVSIVGMTVTISAGAFKIRGVDYELLADDVTTLVADPDVSESVAFYLVKNKSTNAVEVLVDELVGGSGARPFIGNATYELLHQILFGRVIAAATTLEDVPWDLVHFAALPSP
jgi:hypothetical protein